MKLCRFRLDQEIARVGMSHDEQRVFDITSLCGGVLASLLESEQSEQLITEYLAKNPGSYQVSEVRFLSPLDRQEVWAAGVTYLRSKKARMEESNFSASAYDRVYEAERPELFFKSLPEKVVAHAESVGIRRDSRWNVPEPELALVFNSRARLVGCTICNDMSSRDIEGENLLYLPQAKIYDRSCAAGPWIRINAPEQEIRSWDIRLSVQRKNEVVYLGETSVGQIKRTFSELGAFLFRSQKFPHGVALSTGTGIIPPDDFTLRVGDWIRIEIPGIGVLENSVAEV